MDVLYERMVEKTCSPITYIINDVETSIIMLSSKEPDVVARTLADLCKNIESDEKLMDVLISKGVFTKIAELLRNHQNLTILKYTLKLFGLIMSTPANIEKLDKKIFYDSIPRLLRFYILNSDNFVKESCSLILIQAISFNPVLSAYVCFKKFMNKIVKVLRSSLDPDVLKNSLQLFRLLMVNSEEFMKQIKDIKRRHLNVFICLLDCGVDHIADIAMDILHKISAMKIDCVRHKMSKGHTLPKMVLLITSNNKRYSKQAIDIISDCVRNEQAAVQFSGTKHFLPLLEYLNVCDNNSLLRLLPIFSILTKTPSIREKMYAISAEDTLFQFMKYRHETVVLNMCKIISNFTMHKECCKKILTPVVIKYLVDIVKSFPIEPNGVYAMRAMYSFVKYESTALKYLPHNGALDEIQKIFLDNEENYPKRFYEMVAELTYAMACSALAKKLDVRSLSDKILDLLRKEYSNKKVLLKMVLRLMHNTDFRQQFKLRSGPDYFISTIQKDAYSDNYQLNLDVIQNMITYEDMAVEFLDLGLMSLMTSMVNKGKRKSDVYRGIMHTLYDSCLTLKLLEKKYLGDQDTISGLFFLFQHYTIKPTATEFKPIYTVNIERNNDRKGDDDWSITSKTIDTVTIKALTNHSKGMRTILAHSLGSFSFENDFLPKDYFLEQYVKELHKELYSLSLTLKERITKVALFVDRQLSGIVFTDSEEEELLHFKRHINEICMKLGHRFIPLGFLRMGYICEKTFMFKVLCDNLGIPSSFHHTRENLFWNGVSLQQETTNVYIVDFKDKIGRLIYVQSEEGQTYLGLL